MAQLTGGHFHFGSVKKIFAGLAVCGFIFSRHSSQVDTGFQI